MPASPDAELSLHMTIYLFFFHLKIKGFALKNQSRLELSLSHNILLYYMSADLLLK